MLDYPFAVVNAIVAIAALSVSAAVLWLLLRSPVGARLVAIPSDERWHAEATPTFGGVGIFAGFAAGVLVALATGVIEWSSELGGILAGVTIVFVAGLVDDLRHLSPIAKLAAQVTAAVVVLASGLDVEIVDNDILAWGIGLVWLVGITNAFNLLDNMDGLAATLAVVSCAYFAVDALTEHENETVLALALALGLACAGFLPFNLRPRRGAAVFMGDSGSLVIGFGLASLALAASWTVAGTTVATVLLPLLVLAIPILDTTLVTIARLVEKRPVTQGGRDHTSHRLVYYGLSETKAVLLLAIVASAIGATALAYNVLDNGRLTAIGVLVTFVLLVQFGSFLSDLQERSRRGVEGPEPSLWRALIFEPRRLVEVFADFVLICASFLAAYLLAVGGTGTEYERSVYLSALPILLAARYVFFVALGVYRRVWRYATARDVVPIVVGCFGSALAACLILVALRPIGSFPAAQIFLIDALLCTALVGASRLTLRLFPETLGHRGDRKRVLIVGAGRAGRSLARELREGRDERVVGFLDDNPRVRRRRILGVSVVGSLDEAERAIATHASGRSARDDPCRVCGPPRRRHASGGARRDPVPDGAAPGRALGTRAGRGRADMSSRAHAGGPPPRPDFLSRFLSAVPLLVVYFGLAALYAWQASRRPGADDLHGRAGAHAARPLHRRDGRAGASRRAVRARVARRVRTRTGLVARLDDGIVGGGEAHPRPRDDRDRVPGVRAGADGRAEVVRARGGRRLRGRPGARVLADPRRGAARVPDLDDGALADRARARAADLGTRSRRERNLGRRRADANAARDPLRGAGARAPLDCLAVRARAPLAFRVDDVGLGRSGHAGRRRRLRTGGRDRACIHGVAQHDAHLQGQALRARELGIRRARDRHRSSSGSPRARCSRPSERRRSGIQGLAPSSRRASLR